MIKQFKITSLLVVATFAALLAHGGETLQVNMNAGISWSLQVTGAVSQPVDNGNLSTLLAGALTSGTGSNKVNQMFREQRTLAAGGIYYYDLNAFYGTNDALGQPVAMTNVKAMLIQIQGNAQYYYCTAASPSNNLSGTNFVVGDQLVIAPAGQVNSQTILQVNVVSNSVVTNVSILQAGSYSVQPTTANNLVTGGHGSNCWVNLTFATGTYAPKAVFTESDFLSIGGNNTNTWTPLLGGAGNSGTNSILNLYSGTPAVPGTFYLTEGGAVGWPVSSSSKIMKVQNNGANPITYLFVAIGATN